jgi:hypothetical protein
MPAATSTVAHRRKPTISGPVKARPARRKRILKNIVDWGH